jgi:transcription initiation factor TFIIE subunit alpha
MGRFNLATAPIRDALKAVEGVTLPSVNVVAWIAQNVKTLSVVDGELGREEGKRFQVVLGGEGDERERLEKERLAEAQRCSSPRWSCGTELTGVDRKTRCRCGIHIRRSLDQRRLSV